MTGQTCDVVSGRLVYIYIDGCEMLCRITDGTLVIHRQRDHAEYFVTSLYVQQKVDMYIY